MDAFLPKGISNNALASIRLSPNVVLKRSVTLSVLLMSIVPETPSVNCEGVPFLYSFALSVILGLKADIRPKKCPVWYILISFQVIRFWSCVPPRILILVTVSSRLFIPGKACTVCSASLSISPGNIPNWSYLILIAPSDFLRMPCVKKFDMTISFRACTLGSKIISKQLFGITLTMVVKVL